MCNRLFYYCISPGGSLYIHVDDTYPEYMTEMTQQAHITTR
jgi:hypothetical protein